MSTVQESGFDPNQVSFDQGIERIMLAAKRLQFDQSEGVVTSKDAVVQRARKLLTVSNVPGGFTKWQLPVYLTGPSQLFITVAEPGLKVGEHSHDEGDGIRFVAGGSITFEGTELGAGDWMFIPAGTRYSFEVGEVGAIMCYCYCCCCAGAVDLFPEQQVDPPPFVGP